MQRYAVFAAWGLFLISGCATVDRSFDGGSVAVDLDGLEEAQARRTIAQAVEDARPDGIAGATLAIGSGVDELARSDIRVRQSRVGTIGRLELVLRKMTDAFRACAQPLSPLPLAAWWSNDLAGPHHGCAIHYNALMQNAPAATGGLNDVGGVMAVSAVSCYRKGDVMPPREQSLDVGGQ